MEIIDLKNARILYDPEFLKKELADQYFKQLMQLKDWQQEEITVFGRKVLQPRLTAFFGNTGKTYTYSGLKMQPSDFPETLLEIKSKCEKVANTCFNACLANLYRNGNDSMGWHADDEKELGPEPIIASVSLGAERIFQLKHKDITTARHKKRLQHGSLLIMMGKTQEFWKHQLPKTRKVLEPRINLTFRKIF